jgi:hypothetical protein
VSLAAPNKHSKTPRNDDDDDDDMPLLCHIVKHLFPSNFSAAAALLARPKQYTTGTGLTVNMQQILHNG